jgi:hypothetical protein
MRSAEERRAEFERREVIRKAKYREGMDAIAAKTAADKAKRDEVREHLAQDQDAADQRRLATPARYADSYGLDTGAGAVFFLQEKRRDRQAEKRLKKRGLL